MNKIKQFFGKNSKKIAGVVSALAISAFAALSAFATDGAEATGNIDSTMLGAVTSAFTSVKTDVFSIIGSALPIALAIVGLGIAITLGVKYFRKLAK